MSIYFDNYIDEVGNVDDKLTVSSEGFAEITDVLEDLFEQFGFSRVPTDDDIENGLVEFDDKLEYAFTEIRIDLLEAFDNAMDRLKNKEVQS
tara:strand:+ start:275 stop:550 length:276 start_codon:yes stop_codon:yes gene_type:complete